MKNDDQHNYDIDIYDDEDWEFAPTVRGGLAHALAHACARRNITQEQMFELSWEERLELIWEELGGLDLVQHLVTESADDMMTAALAQLPPIVTLGEWCNQRDVPARKARSWIARGYLPSAYQTGDGWLIPSVTPVPVVPRGVAARQARQRAG